MGASVGFNRLRVIFIDPIMNLRFPEKQDLLPRWAVVYELEKIGCMQLVSCTISVSDV